VSTYEKIENLCICAQINRLEEVLVD